MKKKKILFLKRKKKKKHTSKCELFLIILIFSFSKKFITVEQWNWKLEIVRKEGRVQEIYGIIMNIREPEIKFQGG